MKKGTLTIRLPNELRDRVDETMSAFPYRITVTSLVERGLELAIAELAIIAPGTAPDAIRKVLTAEKEAL